jgi:predicted ATPase
MVLTKGEFDKAWQHVEIGLALYRPEAHAHHARLYGGHDPGTCGCAIGALIRAVTGHPDHAVALIERGLALARDLAHPPTLAHALWFAAELRQIRREPRDVEQMVEALLPVVSEHGSAVGIANATMLRGWARTLQGEPASGLAELRRGLSAWRATGSKFHVPYKLARAADACRAAGLYGEGLSLIAEALEYEAVSHDRWFSAELHRLKGEMSLLAGARSEDVEASYQQALALARSQGARLLELRSATSLALLWRSQGRGADAIRLLAPTLDAFTEGLDLADLKEAKALIDGLG